MFKNSSDTPMPQQMNTTRTQADEIETVVGPSVVVEGDFSSEGNILVKGTVSGNVQTGRLLTVEEGAKILANVKASDALVAGEVKGNMRVEEKLQLTQSARVLGDIYCRVLEVESGAIVHGKVTMTDIEIEDIRPERKRAAARTKSKIELMPGDTTEDEV